MVSFWLETNIKCVLLDHYPLTSETTDKGKRCTNLQQNIWIKTQLLLAKLALIYSFTISQENMTLELEMKDNRRDMRWWHRSHGAAIKK